MNRRDFFKALGASGSATTLAACGIDDNRYYTPVEQILPYVTRPEQTTPGTNTHFATSVATGPDAWPVLAVHRDGRVVNVGANRRAAQAAAAVTSSTLFELQRHYSPDRWTGPRKGETPIEWDAGLGELAGAVKAARDNGKMVAWLGPYRGGTMATVLQQFTDGNAVFWEPVGREAEALASTALFGPGAALPRYDLSGAHYVLSFGAPFLSDSWGGPSLQAGFAAARDGNHDHFVARFAAVCPVKDQTVASADDWHACLPGSEAAVALAVARLVAQKNRYAGPGRQLLSAGDPAAAATASGLTVEQIEQIAERFAAGPAIALPGGAVGASTAATQLAAATYLLNLAAGAPGFLAGGYPGPVSSFGDVQKLIADMEAGKVGVLLLDDVNPAYSLPGGQAFTAAMAKVGLSVAVSSHPSESNATVSLVLPTSDVFEDWGDEEPWQGFHILRQPAMSPLHDTRSLGDILLATWRAVDADAAPTTNWHEYLRQTWSTVYRFEVLGEAREVDPADLTNRELPQLDRAERREALRAEAEAPPPPMWTTAAYTKWWHKLLQEGVFERNVARQRRPPQAIGTPALGAVGTLSGSGDLHLAVMPHHFLRDGRYANQPWAQEAPDPMTGMVWDTWALVHPDTAARLGVSDNDAVTITTDAGSLEVGVEVHPCVRPDVIAVPLGGGHTAAAGRYAEDIGVNALALLGPTQDASGAFAYQQAKCTVKPTGGKADLVSTYGADHDRDRNFKVVVQADELAKHGDAESEHPGDMTGIHHLAMDRRLQARGITDFYGLPDHPTYRFGLTVDTNTCTGCGACSVACYAENNLPVVGKAKVAEGREMGWVRINRYFGNHTGDESPSVHFVPLMCQQCGHAPCESVCPVLATYHTLDGLNAMVYNRCVGTRYCSNACPYSARKFNYHSYVWPEPFNLQLNPDVATRTMGVMEKCTFCVQRIRRTKSAYRDQGFTNTVPDEALRQLTACAEACPSQSLTFGNINDPDSVPHTSRKSGRNYYPIADINTFPAVNYLARASYHVHDAHGAGHDAGGGAHGATHEADDAHDKPAPQGAGGH